MKKALLAMYCLSMVLVASTAAAQDSPSEDAGRPLTSCEGEFDEGPTLVRGQGPVWPPSTLSPGWLDDREIRRLPMRWDVIATFRVDEKGRPRDIRSTQTDPPSFASHTNAAITTWRFKPALRAGTPVEALCRFRMTYDLT